MLGFSCGENGRMLVVKPFYSRLFGTGVDCNRLNNSGSFQTFIEGVDDMGKSSLNRMGFSGVVIEGVL